MIRGAGVSMLPAPVVSDHPRQDTANDSGCQPFLVKNGKRQGQSADTRRRSAATERRSRRVRGQGTTTKHKLLTTDEHGGRARSAKVEDLNVATVREILARTSINRAGGGINAHDLVEALWIPSVREPTRLCDTCRIGPCRFFQNWLFLSLLTFFFGHFFSTIRIVRNIQDRVISPDLRRV
jgi:hypothetical protein